MLHVLDVLDFEGVLRCGSRDRLPRRLYLTRQGYEREEFVQRMIFDEKDKNVEVVEPELDFVSRSNKKVKSLNFVSISAYPQFRIH